MKENFDFDVPEPFAGDVYLVRLAQKVARQKRRVRSRRKSDTRRS